MGVTTQIGFYLTSVNSFDLMYYLYQTTAPTSAHFLILDSPCLMLITCLACWSAIPYHGNLESLTDSNKKESDLRITDGDLSGSCAQMPPA